ncbi:MAG: ribose-phosphate pyrophosphokinase [Limnochordaceae bacterium]|uniref:Ribose-phosphate pyrophosphokinase n=1 Tax=Carboxydichorda subterranea TaxID=3109565 RepID=A0ABZ1BWF4_9FIRM|nr:ribose-phosphate pyrophosphokinase [Limnochorda sp. L945t]MBE3599541.1 ribose-phosphate pyrophosphokinase [Limnochordaceae bacterium]WRP17016.1 ribose-phosphate pyrophosphokinase [Limnochorda sp. L945t]
MIDGASLEPRLDHHHKRLRIFSGNANPQLARDVAACLGVDLGAARVGRFRDGEVNVRILESVRGAHVFIIQSTFAPAENVMELLIMIDAMKRASAAEVAAVVPYYGYARQDRKMQARDPISAKLLANLLAAAGADRVLTIDLHAGQIQGFFDIPVDNLKALPILADYFASLHLPSPVVVAPDVGGVVRARELAERLGCGLAICDKRRPEPNVAEVMHVIGDVAGHTAILVDDIIDTGGTLAQAATALVEEGARAVYGCATHGIFSPGAFERMAAAPIVEVVITDTIPLPARVAFDRLRVLSVAPLLAEAIRSIFTEESVSRLFTIPTPAARRAEVT